PVLGGDGRNPVVAVVGGVGHRVHGLAATVHGARLFARAIAGSVVLVVVQDVAVRDPLDLSVGVILDVAVDQLLGEVDRVGEAGVRLAFGRQGNQAFLG